MVFMQDGGDDDGDEMGLGFAACDPEICHSHGGTSQDEGESMILMSLMSEK